MKWKIGSVLISLCLLGSSVYAGIIQTVSSPADFGSLTASTTSLILNGSSTLVGMSATDPATAYGAGGVDMLNDGVLSNSLGGQAMSEADAYNITYTLDTSVNTFGYNISSIRTIAYWGDGRRSQAYEIWASIVGDEGFAYVGSVYCDYSLTPNATSVVVVTPSAGQQVSHVDAIMFRINKFPTYGGTAYSAIEVEGTAVPEPATLALLALGGLFLRRKSA